MSRWFRMYDAVLDDPKVQKLEPWLFKAWVNVLCVASRNNGTIPPADAAFALRLSDRETAKTMQALIKAGLIDNDGVMKPHKWNERQFLSDNSGAERTRRYRERHSVVTSNGVSSRTETAPETETETETEKPDANASGKKKDSVNDRSRRGSRLEADWAPSDEDRHFANELGLDAAEVGARFRDFWVSKPGRDGCKLDWAATWRNWCRNDAGRAQASHGRPGGDRSRPGGLLAAAHAVLAATEPTQQPGVGTDIARASR